MASDRSKIPSIFREPRERTCFTWFLGPIQTDPGFFGSSLEVETTLASLVHGDVQVFQSFNGVRKMNEVIEFVCQNKREGVKEILRSTWKDPATNVGHPRVGLYYTTSKSTLNSRFE